MPLNQDLTNAIAYHGVSQLPVSSGDFTGGITVTDSPATGKKLVVTDVVISANTANAITLKENVTGTVVAGPFFLAANAVFHFCPSPYDAWKLASANQGVSAYTTTTGNCMVDIGYFSEA